MSLGVCGCPAGVAGGVVKRVGFWGDLGRTRQEMGARFLFCFRAAGPRINTMCAEVAGTARGALAARAALCSGRELWGPPVKTVVWGEDCTACPGPGGISQTGSRQVRAPHAPCE